jgi:hypothetical protein
VRVEIDGLPDVPHSVTVWLRPETEEEFDLALSTLGRDGWNVNGDFAVKDGEGHDVFLYPPKSVKSQPVESPGRRFLRERLA